MASAENVMFAVVDKWLADDWPVETVMFPGRSVTWDRWNGLPEE